MKAAVFYGKNDLKILDVEKPCVMQDEVLVQVKACGICGTDMHIFEGDEGAAATPEGTVLGHEFSGIVCEVGKSVKNVSVGDRVCVDPNKLCNECIYCKNGIGHFCENMVGIGTTVNGGFAEFCAVPESQVYKISDKITYEQAAICEPVACCLHGIDMCDINCGDTVLVIGGGMIGLIMLQLAKIKGAAKVILSEPIETKREFGKKLGADLCIDPINQDIHKTLVENGINRITTVIECVGKVATMEQALDVAGKKSTVMFFGLTKPQEEIKVKPFELFKKEITLKASFINPYTMQRALNLIEAERIDVASMIYKKSDVAEIKNILSDKKLFAQGKHIICF